MRNPPTNTDALRVLLERLFPDVRLSGTGVALLAAQIAELEDRCELMHTRVDHQPMRRTQVMLLETGILWPPKVDREPKYRTNDYAK
jgi:hypothetical protein